MSELVRLAAAHVRLAVVAIAFASAAGLAVGVVALRHPKVERLALGAASLVQTVPAIALLAVMVPLLAAFGHAFGGVVSGIGEPPALVALTLYALLPIVRGLVLGVRGIDPSVTQAALAVGMTEHERLRIVELPLAAPSILAGLRTATAWTVGMATLGTPVGAASLGNLIFGGLQTRHYGDVALGCAASAAIAIVLDAALGRQERRATRHGTRCLAVTFGTLGCAAFVSLASGWAPAAGGPAVRIGAKSFTEQLVLAEILRCAALPGIAVEVHPSLGTTVAFDALRAGDLDVYVEYTGTAWTTLLHHELHVGGEGRLDRESMKREVAAGLLASYGVQTVADLGFENAYALVVRASSPARTVADLGSAGGLTFAGDYEFFTRPEWSSLRETYGLSPRATKTMDPSLLYEALASGAVDVIAGYTTDGRIDGLGLRALEDTRGAIPPYDAVVLAGGRLARERPAVVARVRALAGTIDVATMRRWNGEVDRGRSPRDVSREHPACGGASPETARPRE